MSEISKNVKEFEDSAPDFVCRERIESSSYISGKLQEIRTVESTFRSVNPARTNGSTGRARSADTRDIIAIDGRHARPGTLMPKLPFGFSGGFSALLAMTFLPENLEIHDYHIDATDKDAETATIGFSTRAHQQKFHFVWNDESVLSNDIGKAWVDVKAGQVVRLERNFLNLPRGLSRFSTTIEYGPSMIGDRQFWLPRTILTEMTDRDPKKTGKFIAKYNDCKKFTADVKFSQQ